MTEEQKSPEALLAEAKEILANDASVSRNLTADELTKLSAVTLELTELSVVRLMRARDGGDVFWSNLLLFIPKNVDFQLTTATAVAISGTRPELFVNPYLLLGSLDNFEQFITAMKHEGFHLLYNHLAIYHDLVSGGFRQFVNLATDAEINQYLTHLPKNYVTLETLAKKLQLTDDEKIEENQGSYYYFQLLKDMQENQEDSNSDSDNSSSDDSQENEEKEEKSDNVAREEDADSRHEKWEEGTEDAEATEEATRQFINSVAKATEEMLSDGRGTIGSDIQSAIDRLNERPKIKWQSLLRRALSFTPLGKKKTMTRLNRRFPDRLEMRGQLTGDGKEIYAFIDTSGSMEESDLSVALNECLAIAKQQDARLFIGEIDTTLHALTEIKRRSDIHYELTGRGGTRLQPIFDFLSADKISKHAIIVIFTDGEIEDTIDTRKYANVFWILNDDEKLQNFEQSVSADGKKLALQNEKERQ